MGEAFLDKNGGGGSKINGIIEDYYVYAGENISAGSFVEFVNGLSGETTNQTSSDTVIINKSGYGYTISACKITENKVFIAHGNGKTASSILYGVICIIDGTTITKGTDTLLCATSYSGAKMSVVTLSETSVFIAHSYGSSYYLYGIVATIDGTAITAGTDTKLSDSLRSGEVISEELLSNGNVFIAHSVTGSTYLSGTVVTISDKTPTANTTTAIDHSGYYTGAIISTVSLSNSRVFIAHPNGNSYKISAIVCKVSGTTVTLGTQVAVTDTANTAKSISGTMLGDNNVFIAHSYGSNYHLYGIVCTLSNTAITAGTDTALRTEDTGREISTVFLDNGNVVVCHGISTTGYLQATIPKINGTTVTAGNTFNLNEITGSDAVIDAVVLSNNTFFMIHNNNDTDYYLNAQIFGVIYNAITRQIAVPLYETQVRNVTSSNANGIAKTSGVGGSSTAHGGQVSVYVNDLSSFNLIANGDFANGTTGWKHSAGILSFNVIDETLKVEVIQDSSTLQVVSHNVEVLNSNVYYFCANVKAPASTKARVYLYTTLSNSNELTKDNQWHKISGIATSGATATYNIQLVFDGDGALTTGDVAYFDDVRMYNLTAMFGAGNEPTQAWCDANL